MHHPAYSSGPHGGMPWVQQLLVPIFDRTGVHLVFSGHEHLYERFYPIAGGRLRQAYQDPDYFSPPGVIYVITGGGGADLYEEDETEPGGIYSPALSAVRHVVHHAVELEVTQAQLRVRAVAPAGVIDRFTITRAESPAAPRFLLGDANNSGQITITDALTILNFLFLGTAEACDFSGDTNRDGQLYISDAIQILGYLFLGSSASQMGQCVELDESSAATGCRETCSG
jgi:hypothetical protein